MASEETRKIIAEAVEQILITEEDIAHETYIDEELDAIYDSVSEAEYDQILKIIEQRDYLLTYEPAQLTTEGYRLKEEAEALVDQGEMTFSAQKSLPDNITEILTRVPFERPNLFWKIGNSYKRTSELVAQLQEEVKENV